MNSKLALAAALLAITSVVSVSILALDRKETAQGNSKQEKMEQETKTGTPAEGGIILFYGDGCPHCIKVENYMEQNKTSEKIDILIKEVWNNEENRTLMAEKVKACGLEGKPIGVPFLWYEEAPNGNSECIMGYDPIVDFFQIQTAGK